MHKKTNSIIKNLGFSDEIIKALKRKSLEKDFLIALKNLGIPDTAIKQIKNLEKQNNSYSNDDLLNSLIRKCKRSFDAFANKSIKLKLIFDNNKWVLYGSEYTKEIEQLYKICKLYFDRLSENGLKVSIFFDGKGSWKAIN